MIITLNEVRTFTPCYNPSRYGVSRAKLSTVLQNERIPIADRIWLACHVLAKRDRTTLTAFAFWCADAVRAAARAAAYADAAYDYAAARDAAAAARAAVDAAAAARAAVDAAARAARAAAVADARADAAARAAAAAEYKAQINWLVQRLNG